MNPPFPADFLARLEEAVMAREGRREGAEVRFRCPIPGHEDAHPSATWSPEKATWFCHVCKKGGGALDLAGRVGVEGPEKPKPTRGHIVATYDYRDADGQLIFQVVRRYPKSFAQRRPNGTCGWIWDLRGIEARPLYRLPELLAGDPPAWVLVVEGEKDVENLRAAGFVATTNPGGAGKWRPEHTEALSGRRVAILPDNDSTGQDHGEKVARALQGAAAEVRLVALPGDLDGRPVKDASDFFDAGGTAENLRALIEGAPVFMAPPDEPEEKPKTEDHVCAGGGETETRTQGQRLVKLVDDAGATLFHTPGDGDAYAAVPLGNHEEALPVRGRAFKDWLHKLTWETWGRPPAAKATQEAIDTIAARARFNGPEIPVSVRLAEHEGTIYLDLGDRERRAVEIRPEGWRVVDRTPIRFIRPRGMLPLPEPVRGGRVDELRRFANVPDDGWPLVACWLTAALYPRGPFPVLVLNGEQGSGKTFLSDKLQSLVDPNLAKARTEPREARDLVIAASHTWLLVYDNISGLPPWLGDCMCRIATGAGFGTRELYTDRDEVLFSFERPLLLNGIGDFIGRPDLLDRSVIVSLPPIPDEKRRPEVDLEREFGEARPRILGSLLDALSAALRRLPGLRLEKSPRMADFARLAVAAEEALGLTPGSFLKAYAENRRMTDAVALEGNPIVEILRGFALAKGEWTGTVGELLEELAGIDLEAARKKTWPATPRAFAGILTRIAPNLRREGIDVGRLPREAGGGRRRLWRVAVAEAAQEARSPGPGPVPPPVQDQPSPSTVPPAGAGGRDGRDDRDGHSQQSPFAGQSIGKERLLWVKFPGGRLEQVSSLDAAPPEAEAWCREGDQGWTSFSRAAAV